MHEQADRKRSGGRVQVTRTAVMAAVVAVLTISGCSSSGGGASTAPTRTTTPGPSSSAAPSATDPADEARAQAVEFLPTYVQTIDDLYLDPTRPLDDLYEVAVAPEATNQATAIGTFRSQGYRQVGRSELVTATADSVDLTTDSAASPSSAAPTVVVTACVDVEQVQATDASGTSVVPADRPRYLVARLTVVNPDYPDASGWRVSEAPNRQAQSCDG
ncbi:hypothetical protein [Blastococcus sp. TF02-09]|uniref:hypothetical protein n=1 Tax=Blastococcus sp. TF02-09 TaxID=2250576 RepID=UPI001F40753B|nr:hypothetical protein [Blastococcus sp. TF02-9]